MDGIEQVIREFITENFLLTPMDVELAGNESLTRRGIVDSIGVLEVILFLESNYGIEVQDSEVVPANIDTLENIVGFVRRKLDELGTAERAAGVGERGPA